jgi:hypothetical protein
MNRNAQTVATAATRPNRILILLAAAWMALAIALGGVITAEPASDTSAGSATGAIGTVQP